MDKQRLRNLTTGILHTKMEHIYEDLEFITNQKGLMTHMLPNIMRAVKPWLRKQVTDKEYWDKKFSPKLQGSYLLQPMNRQEVDKMLVCYNTLPHPFSLMGNK